MSHNKVEWVMHIVSLFLKYQAFDKEKVSEGMQKLFSKTNSLKRNRYCIDRSSKNNKAVDVKDLW